jgi:hypothetical protein
MSKNYRVEYPSPIEFDVSKTDEEVGSYIGAFCDYVVVATLREAKAYLRNCIKGGREELSFALWTVNNHINEDNIV